MKLAMIFEKPIDRPIEGVIKADDEKSLLTEVQEYVLTNEVSSRLENFLDAYNNYQVANGVWISGFFGSGKSHLLKMMALLLEDREIDGFSTLDLFLPKCQDNMILKAELQRAAAVPSRSILFNIDQKADIISKKEFDAVLAVFVKVFNEMRGYYGKQGHIARFERDLDNQGLYEDFKTAYELVAGRSWADGREIAPLEGPNIASAYAQVTGTNAQATEGILDKYRADYRVSIEDFADEVNDYIQAQGPDFRLNFYVDEVGQYIADNVKLMTNLQTIAESLATKCRGSSWLVVTAQEEMDAVIGEMDKQLGQDFSKIQARFANRMNLTSADVAEVIRRRLLQKNETGVDYLSEIYNREQNNFRTLFDFTDGAQTYRNFRDRDEFIHTYPFIPYQFVLFQSAIQGLSMHSAFQGRHSSVGERSMLGVFQDVAKRLGNLDVGRLATFDLMFEGIRTALKSQVQKSVLTAEYHLDDAFAIQLLKALFLVKYIKEFKATTRNLTVLMLDSFEADPVGLRQKVQAALDLLEQQTYIVRRGEEYEYLTEEERDIEQEIRNTDVENTAILDNLANIVFDEILKQRKVRFENNQDYTVKRKIDDRMLGRESELGIHVISPLHEHSENESILRAHSMGRDELLIILPPDARLMRDLRLYEQTQKYVRQNTAQTQRDSVRRILIEKTQQNNIRLGAIREQVAEDIGTAAFIINGQTLDLPSADAQSRLVRGFQELVRRTYTNLGMLRVIYTEDQIGTYLQPQTTLLGDDPATFSEAEQEILAYIESEKNAGLRTTMRKLVYRFERKPYGWYLAAIQCIMAKLLARGKIEAQRDSNYLENADLERALRNTHEFDNLILIPQVGPPPGGVEKLKRFYGDFFDGPTLANEAKALGQETGEAFKELAQQLQLLAAEAQGYPFALALQSAQEQIMAVGSRPYMFYYEDLPGLQEDLFDLKEQVIDPLRRFMGGSQKGIYDDAHQLLREQGPNLAYIAGDEASQIREILDDPVCYSGPQMQQVKRLTDSLRGKVEEKVQQERQDAIVAVGQRWQRLSAAAEFADLDAAQQAELRQAFTQLEDELTDYGLVAVIRDTIRNFDLNEYNRVLTRMIEMAHANQKAASGDDGTTVVVEPRVEYVPQQSIRPDFAKAWLADEADVDAYLAELKKTMMKAIAEGKRVQL